MRSSVGISEFSGKKKQKTQRRRKRHCRDAILRLHESWNSGANYASASAISSPTLFDINNRERCPTDTYNSGKLQSQGTPALMSGSSCVLTANKRLAYPRSFLAFFFFFVTQRMLLALVTFFFFGFKRMHTSPSLNRLLSWRAFRRDRGENKAKVVLLPPHWRKGCI